MGNQYSHLNIANVGEIIACDFKQISNIYIEIMKTRGVLDSSIESKASKGDQELDLDINAVGFAVNVGSRTNEINRGNKLNPNGCDIYFYGRIHHLVNTEDDGFFEEVNGFLNQTGI
jgi:hypothetical protein